MGLRDREGRVFVETMVVLLRSAPTLEEIKTVFGEFTINRARKEGIDTWEHCGPALFLEYRPEYFGQFVVDVVDRPRPDEMDFDQSDPSLHTAWVDACLRFKTVPAPLGLALQPSVVRPQSPATRKYTNTSSPVRETF